MANYIDNKEFEILVSSFQYNRTLDIENRFVSTLDLLIDTIIHSFNFNDTNEDMKQECFLLIFKVINNFNPSNGSAFNYFTTVILNNLRLYYTKNKIYNIRLAEYMQSKEGLKDLLES